MSTLDLSTLSVLNKEDLRQLLHEAATRELSVTSAELTKRTGLKSYKLRSLKYWAERSHLLNQNALTSKGKLVTAKDPYLETTVTDWLIHFYLSLGERTFWKPPEDLAQWNIWTYVVYRFLPNNTAFTSDELLNDCASIFATKAQEKLKKIIRLILQTYSESKAITKCRFLIRNGNRFLTGNSDLSNPHTVGYLLAEIWERDFGSQRSVLADDILDAELGLAYVLGINREQLQQQLKILARQEIIERRSAKPHLPGTQPPTIEDTESNYQIIRCWNHPLELLEEAYSNDAATPNQPLVQALDGILDDDVPDFSQFLEWIPHLNPKQAYTVLEAAVFDPLLYLVG